MGGALDGLLNSKEPQERQSGKFLTGLEYENLSSALNLALEAEASIFSLWSALINYLDRTQETGRALALGEQSLARLEAYSPENQVGAFGMEVAAVVGRYR
jgi:hypothetical protein